jgi:hypothetical protein
MSSPRSNSLASLKASVTRGFHFAATFDTVEFGMLSRASSNALLTPSHVCLREAHAYLGPAGSRQQLRVSWHVTAHAKSSIGKQHAGRKRRRTHQD